MTPFSSDGAEHDRDEEQKREPRGGVAGQPEEPGRGDRDPRARHAGHQRERLRAADPEGAPEPDLVHRLPLRPAICEPEDACEDGEEDRDLPRLPEVLGDHRLPGGADERRRHRRDRDDPGGALGRAPDPPAGDAPGERARELENVAPEVRDHRDERPQVERDVEGLVEGVVLLEVRPVPEPRHEDQVARRRDGQQLGEPLHDPEHQRLPLGERRAVRLPHARRASGARRGESSDRGGNEGRSAAHAAIDPTV